MSSVRACFLMCFTVAALGCPAQTPPSEPSPTPDQREPAPEASMADLTGYYPITLDPGVGWQRHFLAIEPGGGETVRGRVLIDRNIGPEARMPNPDEVAHLVAFETGSTGGALKVEVSVGTLSVQTWAFDLQFVAEGDSAGFTGTVSTDSGYGPREARAHAPRTERPSELAWPAWEELERGDGAESSRAHGLER